MPSQSRRQWLGGAQYSSKQGPQNDKERKEMWWTHNLLEREKRRGPILEPIIGDVHARGFIYHSVGRPLPTRSYSVLAARRRSPKRRPLRVAAATLGAHHVAQPQPPPCPSSAAAARARACVCACDARVVREPHIQSRTSSLTHQCPP